MLAAVAEELNKAQHRELAELVVVALVLLAIAETQVLLEPPIQVAVAVAEGINAMEGLGVLEL
jgi:hypothetical protein